MNVAKAYITEIASAENVFDMAAVCYKLLENTIANPPVFVSQYIDESDEETSLENKNPNYNCLRSFSEWVGKRLEKYSEYDFPKQKRDIVDMIRQMRLADFGGQGKREGARKACRVVRELMDEI